METSDPFSITGMEIYPLRPSFLAVIPEPLLAGVLGGVCFLFVAIILSLVTACYMSQRRRRRRKRRQGKTLFKLLTYGKIPSFIHFVMIGQLQLFDILLRPLLLLRSSSSLPEKLIPRVRFIFVILT